MKTKRNDMGLGLLAIGMVFLVNPVITIIDVIPDFIGYILMAYGIDRLADMEGRFANAKKGFVALAVISAIKTLVCLLLHVLDGTFVILFAFIFAVGEAICFIPAISNLFAGFHYYGMRLESNACYGIMGYKSCKDENGNKAQRLCRLRSSDAVFAQTVAAFIVRAVCCFLPMLPVIFKARTTISIQSYSVDWTEFIPHFFVLASLITLAVGLPCAISFVRYVRGIGADERLISALSQSYDENIKNDESYFAEKQIKVIKILMILAAVFCFSIYIDYVNWLPGGVAGIFFGCAAFMMRKNSKAFLPCVAVGGLTLIPSLSEVLHQYLYKNMRYTPESFANGIGRSEEMYPPIIISELLTAVMLIATVWIFAKCLSDLTAAHCRLYEKAMPETRAGKGKELSREINAAYRIPFILMTLMCVASGLHGIFAIYYPEFWLVNTFIGIMMLIFLIRAINIAEDGLYDKLKDKSY